MSGLSNLQLLAPRGSALSGIDFTGEISGRQDAGRSADSSFQKELAQLDKKSLQHLKNQLEHYLEKGESIPRERIDPEVIDQGEIDPSLLPKPDDISLEDVEVLLSRWDLQISSLRSGQERQQQDILQSVGDEPISHGKEPTARQMLPALQEALAKAKPGMELKAGLEVSEKQGMPVVSDRLEIIASQSEKKAELAFGKNADGIKVPTVVKQDATQIQANFERMLAGVTSDSFSSSVSSSVSSSITEQASLKPVLPTVLTTDVVSPQSLLNTPTSSFLASHVQSQPQVGQAQQQLSLTGDMARWSEVLGEKLAVLAGQGQQEARIRLDPPELGKLGINLSLDGNELSVRFQTAVAPVREMIESRFEQLRASLSNQGLELVSVDVDSGRQHGGNARGSHSDAVTHEDRMASSEQDDVLQEDLQQVDIAPQLRTIHLLDTFV